MTGRAWLRGAAAAMVLTFDVDAESCVLAEDERYARHPGALSHQAYGPRVGVPRILTMLADLGVRATFMVPGRTAELWPDTVTQILSDGHEIAHHSYAHRRLVDMSPTDEIEDLERGLAALHALGVRPVGHRSPLSAPSLRTAGLLAQYGFRYQSTLMDDDRPYLLDTRHGPLAEIPPSWLLDDFAQFGYLPDPRLGSAMRTPEHALALWTAELDAMRATGSVFVLCAHPFLSGRPSRVQALRCLVETALARGDVTVLTGAELAERAHADPAVTRRPEPVEVTPGLDKLRSEPCGR